MSAAPWPLGSSVTYWMYGKNREWGFYVIDRHEVRAGDIAIMGRGGNPADGYGPVGHTAVVDRVEGAMVLTMESYGHHGIDWKWRPMSFWSGFVRWSGTTPAMVDAMREFISAYSVTVGVVLRVPYYNNMTDVNRDGVQDRAAVGDGNGVDCSGLVWLLFAYAVARVAAGRPVDAPNPRAQEHEVSGQFLYGDGFVHQVWIDQVKSSPTYGDVLHLYGPPSQAHPAGAVENLTRKYAAGKIGAQDPYGPCDFAVKVDSPYGTVIVGTTRDLGSGALVRWAFEGSPITWHAQAFFQVAA